MAFPGANLTFSTLPSSLQYSESLNCVIATSEDNGFEIIDIHSGKKTCISFNNQKKGLPLPQFCTYVEKDEKLVVTSGHIIGCHSTNNEQVFLKTILQVSEIPVDGEVTIELGIAKAGLLLVALENCVKTTDPFSSIPGMSSAVHKKQFEEVINNLRDAYEKSVLHMKDASGHNLKWLTVCITMEHSLMTNVFNTALLLIKQEKRGPALPVIGDVLQRLTSMQKTTYESISSEKRLMFNEIDRLQTFMSWPHMNYKWALPGPMAEAGFYHPHTESKAAEDRAMCFTCSVCLVCWESSDQPWSEHKRHYPNCPFVKGDYTENVSLQDYAATAGAKQLPRLTDTIVCLSGYSFDNLIAVGTKEGYIVVWETFPSLKIHSEYQISVSTTKDSHKKSSKTANLSKITKNESSSFEIEIQSKLCEDLQNDNIVKNNQLGISLTDKQRTETSFSSKDPIPLKSLASAAIPVFQNDILDKMTDIVVGGESYCVINNLPPNSITEDIVQESSLIEQKGDDQKIEVSEALQNENITKGSPKMLESTNSSSKSSKNSLQSCTQSRTKFYTQKSCKITSVAIMKDSKTAEKFIIAGVKIDSLKNRKFKQSEKHKLSLLTYKIANKISSNEKKHQETSDSFLKPYTQSFMPIPNNAIFEVDSSTPTWFGLDDDYGIYDIGDSTQLSIIDEYLIASKQLGSSNGGTQNIAGDVNEIKTGFDQEEVIKLEDSKTVYKDCAFHKFDLCDSNLNKFSVISKLLVVDDQLIVIVKDKLHKNSKPQSSIFIISVVFDSSATKLQKVAFHSFKEIEINDIISVACSELPANILTNLMLTKLISVLIVALSDNSVIFLSVPGLEKLPLQSNLPNNCSIHRLAYCSSLSGIAVCDEKGRFSMHQWTTALRQHEEVHTNNVLNSNQWPSRFSTNELKLLCDLIRFEPVTQGCNIVYPMNWCVNAVKKSLKTPPVALHMLRLSPVEMDNQLLKETERGELSKTDFTFEVCVSLHTAIGYFDIIVNLKSPLKSSEDFSCSFFVNSTHDGNGCQAIKKDNHEIQLCDPILFSDVANYSRISGKFTVTVPKLLQHQSIRLIIKLVSGKSLLPDFSVSDALKEVFVGVQKFQSISYNPFYYTGCRQILISESNFQSNLLDQYLELVSSNCSMLPGKDAKMILKILSWIVSIHLNCITKSSLPLISIVHKKLWQFLKASMMYGDRSVCHSCFNILLGLIRCSSNCMFVIDLSSELRKLLPNIHNAFSAAAIHWTFLLLCKVVEFSEVNSSEMLLHFKTMLMQTGKSYGDKITETHKYLDAVYGLSEMVSEPLLTEPHYLQLHIGSSFKTGDTAHFEVVRIAPTDIPGVLESQPLKFVCLDASEGSKVQQINSKSNISKLSKAWSPIQGTSQLQKQADLEKPSELLHEKDESTYFELSNTNSGISIADQKTFSIISAIENAADDSYLPPPKCMIVEKMHLSSWHYVILDFQAPVLLTDFIIPPCKALGSIMISIWGTSPELEHVIAYSDEISSKALIMSNLVEPISLQYLKILVMGGISSSVAIPLGQFYGYLQKDILSSATLSSYSQQYEDLFCRFTSTIERFKPISSPHEGTVRFSKGMSLLLSSLKKDHALSFQLQLSLNFLRNNIVNQSLESLLQKQDFENELTNIPCLEDASFSCVQVILLRLLETMFYYLTLNKNKSEISCVLLQEEFIVLFEKLCVYGVCHLTNTATIVLCMLCGNASWWSDALVEVFKKFFCINSLVPVPRGRLFKLLAQLIHSSKDKEAVLEKFLVLLQNDLNALLHPDTSSNHVSNESMLDWLLLVLCTLLESPDFKLYNYLSPWESLKPSLSDSVPIITNPSDNKSLSSEKLLNQMFVKLPVFLTSSSKSKDISEDQSKNEEVYKQFFGIEASDRGFETSFVVEQTFFIQRNLAISTFKALMEFISLKIVSGNLHQLTLACKVSSLVLINCRSIIYIEDILSIEHFQMLYMPCLESNSKQWHLLAINTLVKCFLNQKSCSEDRKVEHSLNESCNPPTSKEEKHKKKKVEKKNSQETVFFKKFLEMTEGKTLTNLKQKQESSSSLEKESESLAECMVTHVILEDIFSLLESDGLKLQSKVSENLASFNSWKLQKQNVLYSDHEMFSKGLKKMQISSLHYLLNCLLNFDMDRVKCSLFIQQILFFAEHMMTSGIKPSNELAIKLENVLVQLFSKISTHDLFAYNLFKQLIALALEMDVIPASFIYKLIGLKTTCLIDFELAILSLCKLTEKIHLQPDETVVAQQLFSVILSNKEIDGDSKIVSLLEKIWQSKLFSHNIDQESTLRIALLVTERIKMFVTHTNQRLDLCQKESASNKSTIFFINEGCVKLAGKIHHNEDVTECLKLLKILSTLDFTKLASEQTLLMEKVCLNLLDALCICPKLRIKNGLAQNTSLTEISGDLLSSAVHPIVFGIIVTLTDLCSGNFSNALVSSLVAVLQKRSKQFEWKGDLVILMKSLLTQNSELFPKFVMAGGFKTICDAVLFHSKKEISWVDTLHQSPVMQELYSVEISQLNRKHLDQERTRADKLENFAPYARIIPSGADVLLVDKTPLRRSRFAAWAHQFQDSEDPWLQLHLIFPFQLLLKEVIIHMHASCLPGAPSQVMVEYKAMSNNFIKASPIIETSGLSSIDLHFTEGIICKELRLCLHRPRGCDSLKLNLLELFGRTIFTIMDKPQKLNFEVWIDLLSMMLTDNKSSIELIKSYLDDRLLDSLICVLPFLTRLSLHRISTVLMSIFLRSLPDFAYTFVMQTTKHMLQISYLNRFSSSQLQLLIQLLSDIVLKTDSAQQIRIFSYLFEWFAEFLNVAQDDCNARVSDVIQCFIVKLFLHAKSLQIECKVSEKLLSGLEKFILNNTTHHSNIAYLGQLLQMAIESKQDFFLKYLQIADTYLNNSFLNNTQFSKALDIIVFAYQSKISMVHDKTYEFLGKLSRHFADILSQPTVDSKNVKSACMILSCLCKFSSANNGLSIWFYSIDGRLFWKQLLQYTLSQHVNSNVLLHMYKLQQQTIQFFHNILYLNKENMYYFCKILIDVLYWTKQHNLAMSGYLKQVIMHLVIAEDTIIVHFKSKWNMYILQNTHKLHFRITATLNEIEQTLFKIKSSAVTENKVPKSDNNKMVDLLNEQVLQSGKLAIFKRQPKSMMEPTEKSSSTLDEQLGIDFFQSDISNQPLPKKLSIGQILQLLHEKDPIFLDSPPLIEYCVRYGKSNDDAAPIENNVLLSTAPFSTMLEMFANFGGLSLLSPKVEDNHQSFVKLFSLILPLPGFSSVFLEDRTKAEFMLRIMMGVMETKAGQVIQELAVAQDLHVLPLMSLWKLLLLKPSTYKHFIELRKEMLKQGVLNFIISLLECLVTNKKKNLKPSEQSTSQAVGSTDMISSSTNYWAKGTGFGTGSTASNWDIEKALSEKKKEEKQVVVIFQVLAAFLCEDTEILNDVYSLFENSCITEVLSGYLRNDSVFDMSHHIVLYHAILKLVQSLASSTITLRLLIGMKGPQTLKESSSSIVSLLSKLKSCVETYNKRLKVTNKPKRTVTKSRVIIYKDEEDLSPETDTEELNILLDHIELISDFVQHKAEDYDKELNAAMENDNEVLESFECLKGKSNDELYVATMSRLQFDTYEIITEKEDGTLHFNVPFYYASAVRSTAGVTNDAWSSSRARRLAQEVATLSTSLPLSYSSTVFLRCDDERLDVMKVLITGPEDTPYENGCFEFDVYFPAEYPASPMSVNLRTTGKQTVRFNPNLYNDGKVCLSVLNTWHGRPEERWNPQTSSLLQVLVSIQSLILVSEPYFNEPGYERMRTTPQGQQNSCDYNANIQQATIKWAMVEQIKRPSLCFREIIHKHFLMKQAHVIAQCERWLAESKRKASTHSYESMNNHLAELKIELMKLEKNQISDNLKEVVDVDAESTSADSTTSTVVYL